MPRFYKRKEGVKKRVPIDSKKLKQAVEHVLNGNTIKGTAKSFGLSIMTLKRYVRKRKVKEDISYEPDYTQAKVFTKLEEDLLAAYLEKASKLHHGLTAMCVRKLAYQFAIENSKPPKKISKWANETATYDWLYGFMKRNQQLSLRVPEATSLSRSTSFNRHNMTQFYNNLRTLMEKHKFGAESIWNIDETGLTTVHKPKKIVASKGLKQVGKITSGERGELVTACCGINALGGYVPPFMIFPRKNWQDRMLTGAPTGTDGTTFPSGWMTAANFVKFLQHFKKYSKCSLESPCLLIMDNHDSHISIESLNFAKENGIHLLTIPPHTSHKTQPLDRTVFGPLKAYFNTACDNWMIRNAGKPITIYDISECLGQAFLRAFTPQNIQSGFRATGIFPFDCNIFTDDDYLCAYVTDRPEQDHTEDKEIVQEIPEQYLTTDVPQTQELTVLQTQELLTDRTGQDHIVEDNQTERPHITPELAHTEKGADEYDASHIQNQNNLTDFNQRQLHTPIISEVDDDLTDAEDIDFHQLTSSTQNNAPNPITTLLQMQSSTSRVSFRTPEEIKPFPKAGPRKTTQKGRKKSSTRILTDTPEKNQIIEELLKRKKNKEGKEQKTKARHIKKTIEKVKKVKLNLNSVLSSSSDEDKNEIPLSLESVYDVSEDVDQFDSSSCESENEYEPSSPIKDRDWVIVNLMSMKNLVHRYVGQVKSSTEHGYVIQFAKKINDHKFKCPIKDDISEIARYQVVKKIEPPTVKSNSRRVIAFEFKKSLRKFNIE